MINVLILKWLHVFTQRVRSYHVVLLSHREVPMKEAKEFAESIAAIFIETSARNAVNVEELFQKISRFHFFNSMLCVNIYYFESWQGEGYVMTERSPQKLMNGGFLVFILLLQECNRLHLMKMFWLSEVICCRPAPSYLFMNTRISDISDISFMLWISKKKKKRMFERKMTLWFVCFR